MPTTSLQRSIFTNLTYVDQLKDQITRSGGTIVFTKDNMIVASEVSESQYRELLKSPYVEKIDVLPLKRYANQGVKYKENVKIVDNTRIKSVVIPTPQPVEPTPTPPSTPPADPAGS
jgi:hypothetical protein